MLFFFYIYMACSRNIYSDCYMIIISLNYQCVSHELVDGCDSPSNPYINIHVGYIKSIRSNVISRCHKTYSAENKSSV